MTPAGDAGQLHETAASLLAQSLQNWEWLIVGGVRSAADGGLPDDPRIRLTDAPLRMCVSEAHSDFVLFLNAGDLLEPTAAEKWLWLLASYPQYEMADSYHVVFGAAERLDPPPGGPRPHRWLVPRATGVVRRSALAGAPADAFGAQLWAYLELRLRRATLPEYLHWHRAGDGEDGQGPIRAPERPRRLRAKARTRPATPELERLPFANGLAKGARRRLLLLVPWMITGGAEKFNLDLIAQLSARGWEVTVATTLPAHHTWAHRHEALTPDVFVLQYLVRGADFPRFLRYAIESRRPDVILIANSEFAYRALPYIRRHARDAAVCDYCHSVVLDWLDGGYPRLSVDRQELLDLQITSSAYLKRWMTDEGADPSRIEVCYTNVRELQDTATELPRGLPEDRPLILYPCRVDVEKQPAVFARTLLGLRRQGHRFAGVVVGDGPYLQWLTKFARDNGLDDSLFFLGRQPNDRVRRMMARSACVFLPSQYEGISLAFFEAMAEGVPVVGAAVGGQAELVTPECGVLVERGTEREEVERYTHAVGELLANPEKRAAMGEAARRRIREHFDLDQMGERMDELLELARENARRAPRAVPTKDVSAAAALAAARAVPLATPYELPQPWRLRPRQLALYVAQAVGMPIHRLAMRLGFHWVEGLRRRVAEALQPKGP